jgi:energy-coupling factor transporter transmembrane protein EcfT
MLEGKGDSKNIRFAYTIFVFVISYFMSKELFDAFFWQVVFSLALTILSYILSKPLGHLSKLSIVITFVVTLVLFAAVIYYLNLPSVEEANKVEKTSYTKTKYFLGEWETKQNDVNFNLLFNSKEDVVLRMSPENTVVYFKYGFENDCIVFLDTSNSELRMSWCLKVKKEDFFKLVEDGDTITFFKKKD